MNTTVLKLGTWAIVSVLAGVVAAGEPSPSGSGAATVGDATSQSVDASFDSLLPISVHLVSDQAANESVTDVDTVAFETIGDNGCLSVGESDCEPCCVFRGGAIILRRSTPAAVDLVSDPNGGTLINAGDLRFGFQTGLISGQSAG